MRTRIQSLSVALLTGLLLLPPGPGRAQPADAAIPVGIAPVQRRVISKALAFVGRGEAVSRVEVRARVVGYLEAVEFKEGDLIKDGAPLYRIEPELFEAAVMQAEGALQRSKAGLKLAEIQFQRAQELLDRNAGTVVARDQARAAQEQSLAAVMTDEGNLQTARINLGYTQITSPIAGRVGRTSVTKGNVVGPDSGVLTTIVSQDPIYVTFPVSQREFLRLSQDGNRLDPSKINVQLKFSDGSVYPHPGKIDFVNISVDRATDTVLVRAVMPNPDGALKDGQLARVLLQTGEEQEKVVVPQAALIADQGGVYIFVVEDGKAVIRRIKTSGESGTEVVVDDGLSGSEQVIVDGLQRVKAGSLVRGVPATRAVTRS